MRKDKVRNKFGKVLKVSRKSKQIFQQLSTSSSDAQFKTSVRRLVKSLHLDMWSCPHHSGAARFRRREFSRLECSCLGGGMVQPPDVKFLKDQGQYREGEYKRSLFQGIHVIIIKLNDNKLDTLLHEITHWLDDDGYKRKLSGPSHGVEFHARLADLKRRLDYKEIRKGGRDGKK